MPQMITFFLHFSCGRNICTTAHISFTVCYEAAGPQSTLRHTETQFNREFHLGPDISSSHIIRYKRHAARFCQNNPNFKDPHPKSYCEKSFLGKPQGRVSLKGSLPKRVFFGMLSDCLKMNTGENKTYSFSFFIFVM